MAFTREELIPKYKALHESLDQIVEMTLPSPLFWKYLQEPGPGRSIPSELTQVPADDRYDASLHVYRNTPPIAKKYRPLDKKVTSVVHEIMLGNQGLIHLWARSYANRYARIGFEDFFQEGQVGLRTATFRYDPHRGWKFSTYAVWWIRQSMQRYQQNNGKNIRLPTTVHEMLAGVSSRTRYPWLDDGTAYVGKESSLHSPIPGTELLVDETIADENTIDDVLENNRSTSLVRNALRSSNISLTDKERIILHMRFGIDCQEKTLNEIGADFGVSRERIRQIEAIALGKIEIYLRRHQKR